LVIDIAFKGIEENQKKYLQEVRLAQGAGNFVGQCLNFC